MFSVLLRLANAFKVLANAIKIPDQHKYEHKWISASYKIRGGIEILISFNYLKRGEISQIKMFNLNPKKTSHTT